MWGAHDGMGWWMVFGMAWMVVFWGAIVYAVFWVASRGRRDEHRSESPLDILKRRYAGGEISKEEFDRMRQELA